MNRVIAVCHRVISKILHIGKKAVLRNWQLAIGERGVDGFVRTASSTAALLLQSFFWSNNIPIDNSEQIIIIICGSPPVDE